jgi:hypothetical protein
MRLIGIIAIGVAMFISTVNCIPAVVDSVDTVPV